MKRLRNWLLSTTCLMAVSAMGSAQAADLPQGYGGLPNYGDLPAVSQLNGKLSAFGGSQDGGLFGVTGSLTAPLGHDFGAQIDGMVGSGKGAAFYGVGGHLFWRDPAKGLLGIYGSYVSWAADDTVPVALPLGSVADLTGAEVGKLGVEGEAYLGRFSLEGLAAYQFGTNTGFAGKATLAYYPVDTLRLDGGVRYLDGVGAVGTVGAEWQPHIGSGFTVFASGSFGDDYSRALAGARIYFGDPNKSLIQRHRQDDPGNDLPDDLFIATGGTHCPAGQTVHHNDGGAFCADPN